MKKSIAVFAWILAAGFLLSQFTSCKKEGESVKDDLVGTWTIDNVTLEVTVEGKSLTEFFVDAGFSQSDAAQFAALFETALMQSFTGTVQFKADNTYTATVSGDSNTGTWEVSSDGKKSHL
jgi:hypothetical protein